MKALIDDAARKRIEGDLDVSMCVEAGAGTGKTTMLVSRIVALLREDRATIDQLGVITFTEKAAAELSARVRFALEVAAEDTTGEEKDRLDAALLGLHRARVQTIHSFAGDLLRERPVEAGIDPQFTVLEDLAASMDFDTAYQRWLDDLLASSRQEVEVATRRGFELSHLRQVAEIVHQHRHVLPLAASAPPVPDVAGYRSWAAEAKAELDECGPTCVDEDDGAFKQLAGLSSHLAIVTEADEAEFERLVLFESPKLKTHVGQQGNWSPPGNCERVRAIYKEFRARQEKLRDALRTQALSGMLGHVERFVAGYANQRRREGTADFDDLLIWSRDLVRDNATVRDHFRRRTTHILVDEFQDTDPIQAELISWISAAPGASGDWRAVTPESGSLFVVGDPKQSIYRFRGADIAAYDAMKRGPLAGHLERLGQNFRSTDSLLGWVNEVFDRVFVERPGIQPGNTHLHAWGTPIDGQLDHSSVVVVHSLDDWAQTDNSVEAMREEESSLLARTIWRAVKEDRWPVRDRHAGDVVRPASWGDAAILIPSRSRVELLEAALQRHGVPYRLEGGRGFYARQEVRDLISLLEAIDDPTDSIAIVAALRSLAFGCSDDELLLWRVANERFDYRWRGADGPASVREALAAMAALHRAQRSLSLGELVRTAVERSGVVEAALTVPGGDQAAANVLKVVDIAQAFAGAGGGALRGFTNWLASNRDEEEREGDAPVSEERDDLVRIMTIHAAKGLEFPIVCLANAEWVGPGQVPPVPDAVNHRVDFTVGNVDYASFCTPDWDRVKPDEKEALEAERDRLLYVAVTRARDHLVVPSCHDLGERKGFVAKMSESVGQADPDRWGEDVGLRWQYDTRELEEVAERDPEIVSVDPGTPADAGALAERDQAMAEREASVRAASGGVELVIASSVKSDVRPLVAEADAATSARDDMPAAIETDATPPLELGDAFHRVMELVDLPEATTLKPLAAAICEEHGIPDSAEAVIAMARLTLAALERDGLPIDAAHREIPFVVPDDDRFLVGRIDLVAGRSLPTLEVVDYKTNARGSESLATALSSHVGQLENYQRAAEMAADREVIVSVVFTRTGETAVLPRSQAGPT